MIRQRAGPEGDCCERIAPAPSFVEGFVGVNLGCVVVGQDAVVDGLVVVVPLCGVPPGSACATGAVVGD